MQINVINFNVTHVYLMFLFFSIHKTVWPADADKIANLAY